MPTVQTVKSCLALEPGTPIDAFKARVKKVFKQDAGTSDAGRDWKRQSIICADGTWEISVTLWNHSQIKEDWQGKIIYICADSPKFEVKEYTNKKTGKTTKQLSVPEEAEIAEAASLSPDNPAAEQPVPFSAPPQAPTPSHSAALAAHANHPAHFPQGMGVMPGASGGMPAARVYVAQAANLMQLSWKAAMHSGKEIEKGAPTGFFITPEHLGAMAVQIFRAARAAGHVGNMPVGPMENGGKVKSEPVPAGNDYEPGSEG